MQATFSPSPEPHEQSICSHDTIESLRRDLSLLSPTASHASISALRSSRSPFLSRSAERTGNVGKDPRRHGSCEADSPAKENQAPQSEGARAPSPQSKGAAAPLHDHASAASRGGDRNQRSALGAHGGAHSHRDESVAGGCCSGRCREERLVLVSEQARVAGLGEQLQRDCAAARQDAARWEREASELAVRAAEAQAGELAVCAAETEELHATAISALRPGTDLEWEW
ncbi:hypothetical protein T484DRAFT_1825258 [Baffinella frigidus]|nr:hypothetical protein T484DRAFT_1825258 [Cryptophyta sp. CCMP2293]